MRIHIVTGATGYLGSHLVFEILQAYPQDAIVCLARGNAQEPATLRVHQAVRIAARTSSTLLTENAIGKLHCTAINPLQAGAADAALLSSCLADFPADTRRVFWHLAASVSFVESEAGELHRINYEGSLRCLELACAAGAHEFNYVSTAYVAGDRSGRIEAELSAAPPRFCNPYEASKFAAERMVRDFCRERGLPMRIFRPSIIAGHSCTHLSSSDSGIYKYADLLLGFWEDTRKYARRHAVSELTVVVPDGTTLNVIPVDICAREMLQVAQSATSLGAVYHLTSRNHIPTRHFHLAFSELTGIPVHTINPGEARARLTRLDVELGRRLSHYGPYVSADKRFVRDGTLAFCEPDLQAHVDVDRSTIRAWLERYLTSRQLQSRVTPDASLFAAQTGCGVHFNVAGWLVRNICTQRRANLAIRSEDGKIPYAELARRISATAQALAGRGVIAGGRVALMAVDSIASVSAMLGVMYAGAAVIHINPLMPPAVAVNMLIQARANLLIGDSEIICRLSGLDWYGDMLSLDELRHLECGSAGEWREPALVPAHFPAFGVFTSGSTGQPKLVMHPHISVRVATDRYAAQLLAVKSSDAVFSASRLSFAFGLQNLFISLAHGATAILPPRTINAESIVETINRCEPTVIFAVPTIYQMILNRPTHACVLRARGLRACIAAGERLPDEIGRRWQESFGLPILDSLGSSEVFSTYLSNITDVQRPGATGKLVPGFDAMLHDESGMPCKNGESGVLWIRGPSVIPAYADPADGTEHLFQDGWFCTKDVFWRDADGYFYYRGRQSEMFKVAGQWISPTEIEEVLLRHPRVTEAAVAATGGDATTARPRAFIVVTPGSLEGLEEEIRQFCKDVLGSWKYPHFVEFVPALPRTPTGKLRRFALAARPVHDHAAPI
jgi:acyl-coenzyme A synthetase/AMP-(fatty) acid ligase/nucleoside-diphosphate-sugar epimerase